MAAKVQRGHAFRGMAAERQCGKSKIALRLLRKASAARAVKDIARGIAGWALQSRVPKDDTPGCTIQGQSFTRTRPVFDGLGVAVVGVSQDDVGSHKSFCNKFGFSIDLLADPNANLLNALDVGQTEYKGTMYWNRTTFVVDPKGILRKVYTNVKPDGHEQVLLNDIKTLQAQFPPAR